MDVQYSDNVVNIVKKLREKVYGADDFKNLFAEGLKLNINATTVEYIPDRFGGWSININTNNDKQMEYDECLKTISETLVNTISQLNNKSSINKDMSSHLANVIMTGPYSVVIKI